MGIAHAYELIYLYFTSLPAACQTRSCMSLHLMTISLASGCGSRLTRTSNGCRSSHRIGIKAGAAPGRYQTLDPSPQVSGVLHCYQLIGKSKHLLIKTVMCSILMPPLLPVPPFPHSFYATLASHCEIRRSGQNERRVLGDICFGRA